MKLAELVLAQEALRELVALKLPADISFQIARALRPIDTELRNYEEIRLKLIQRLGEHKDNHWEVKPENREEFDKEYNALINVDLDLDIKRLKPSILGQIPVAPSTLFLLSFLFENEECATRDS